MKKNGFTSWLLAKEQKKNNHGTVVSDDELLRSKRNKYLFACMSFVFAMLLWLFVVDPVTSMTVSIPVHVNGLTENSIIVGKNIMVLKGNVPQNVDITLHGRKSYIDRIVKQNFATVLDYTKISSASQTTLQMSDPIYNGGNEIEGVRVIGMSPKSIKVELEQLGNNKLPLFLKTIGSPQKGYKLISMSAEPNVIRLTGDKAINARAAKAVAYVDVQNITSSSQNQVEVRILDKNNEIIEEINDKYYADVKLNVGKRVEVRPDLQGKPNERYTFRRDKVKVSPKYITVTGNSQTLKNLNYISTEEIDISSFDRTVSSEINLVLPNGVQVHGGRSTVMVTIPIKNVEIKTLHINKSNIELINTPANETCNIIGTPTTVTVTGPAALLKTLTTTSLRLNINMDGAETGVRDYGISVAADSPIQLVGYYKAKISVQ